MYGLRLKKILGARTSVTLCSWAWAGLHQLEIWFWTGSRTGSPSPRSCTGIQYFPGSLGLKLSFLLSATQEIPVRASLGSVPPENAAPISLQSEPVAICKNYPQN